MELRQIYLALLKQFLMASLFLRLLGKKYMKLFNDVFFSFTYGGECIGLAAAKACIKKFKIKKY